MKMYDARDRGLKGLATMAVMALGVTAVPLAASAFATADAVPGLQVTSALEDADLIAMRDEERLAGDTYTALAEITGHRVFSNIARAEEQHETALERLLTARGVDVDALDDTAGEYSVDAYEDLYDEYLERGDRSLDDALEVGVEIEERDIADLQATLEQDLTRTESRVVTALLRGSNRHLAAFTRALEGDYPDGAGPGNGPGPRWDADGGDHNGFGHMRGRDRQGSPGLGKGFGQGAQRGLGGRSMGQGPGPGAGQGAGPGSADCPFADTDS